MKIEKCSAPLRSERIEGFDFLRGVCAIGVACYHLLLWTGTAQLFSIGTYGVYIFFILSGASMCVAYGARFAEGYSMANFLWARFLRLSPLMVLVVLINAARLAIKSEFDVSQLGLVFLNFSLLFGFGNPGTTSLITGGWSLGIEFVFYVCFPLFLALTQRKTVLPMLLVVFLGQHIFINYVLSGPESFVEKWGRYTQFLSFSFYFLSGCAIGNVVIQRKIPRNWWAIGILIGSLILMGFTRATKTEDVLTGWVGMALSLIAAVTVAAAAAMNVDGGLRIISKLLGNMSYGLYLLHPLIYIASHKFIPTIWLYHPAIAIVLVIFLSGGVALMLEHWYEAPLRKYFRKSKFVKTAMIV